MESLESIPTRDMLPEDTWMKPAEERKTTLHTICEMIVQRYANFQFSEKSAEKYDDCVFAYATEAMSLGLYTLRGIL